MPRRVYEEKNCSRCNAIAHVHAYPRDGDMIEFRLDCGKCKLSKYVRVVTKKYVILLNKEEKYLKMLERAPSEQKKKEIQRALSRIRRDMSLAEVYG